MEILEERHFIKQLKNLFIYMAFLKNYFVRRLPSEAQKAPMFDKVLLYQNGRDVSSSAMTT